MTPLWRAFRLVWGAERSAMRRGAALTVCVLAMGAGLLALSGWFITAAGAAGLAGIGVAFDVFRPSAGIRFLALGRTAARYGERLLTHDATLRALSALRIDLLRRQAGADWDALTRLRGETALTRITADVDALDGVALRLALPVMAGLVTLALAFAGLAWLTHPAVALAVSGGFALGGALALWRMGRASLAPSARAEQATQRLRRAMIDLSRARRDLVVFGRMPRQRARVLEADAEARAALARLDAAERRAGLVLGALTAAIGAGALALGGRLAASGDLSAPLAALGFFAALGLAETVAPLRRGVAELGRMRDAAGRIFPGAARPDPPARTAAPAPQAPAALEARELTCRRPGAPRPVIRGVSLTVAPGETVALVGASGSGKSTLLALMAGLLTPETGEVRWRGRPLQDWPEPALRAELTLVPQRSALIAGTIRDNLALARDALDDAEALAALEAAALAQTVAAKGGLSARLGERGAGLSGGEARRLALARGLLRRPRALLLDEPTEGLDAATARAVLAGIRRLLPGAAILVASHRPAERAWADRVVRLT
ncbi:MAG: amino acid ABC transporter ATP-binding/permease protein [Pseudomonadota bacterium]